MRHAAIVAAAIVTSVIGLIPSSPARAAEEKKAVPYFASINAGRARMRTGPARIYPASWLYQRAGLPIRVVAAFKEWRKVEDPDGTTGWMQANLLTEQRGAIVRSAVPIEMHEKPNETSRLMWRAAPGVVGRISQCDDGWCRFDVKGQAAFVRTSGLWGVEPSETLP